MQISPVEDRPTRPGGAEWFTGEVRLDPLFAAEGASRAGGVSVAFAPGARTHWHTHPRGQVLIVTAGLGRAQAEGGPVVTIRPGDVVRFGPGERHWHGAAPGHAMTHVAIHESDETGSAVTWAEPVTDADYDGQPGT